MSLLGTPFLLLVLAGVVVVLVAVAGTWSRWPRRLAWPARLVGLVLVMVAGAALAATLVNRSFGFYATVTDLTARAQADPAPPGDGFPAHGGVEVLDQGWQQAGYARAEQGRGSVLDVRLTGGRSGFSRPGLVYLPAAWFLGRDRPLAVVELLHGYPGIPANLQDQLKVGDVLDREIGAHRMPPVVAVAPKTYQGRASECVDAGRGHLDETYLAFDVPLALHQEFGTLLGRSLGMLGYSEGGFCAVDMGLHHPERVAAAVSLSGYFTAGTDPHTLDLYRRAPGRRKRDSPVWWVQHRTVSGPPLLLVASRGDLDSVEQDDALRRAARHAPRLPLAAAELPDGGHNFVTFARELAPGLDFLGAHLPAQLARPLLLPPAPPISPVAPGHPERALTSPP